MTYEVVRYAASGRNDEDGEILASGLSLEEARRLADKGFGSWRPHDEGEIIGYHESPAENCGGYIVREAGGARD